MDGVANEEDYDQYGDSMREDDADDDETYVTCLVCTHGSFLAMALMVPLSSESGIHMVVKCLFSCVHF